MFRYQWDIYDDYSFIPIVLLYYKEKNYMTATIKTLPHYFPEVFAQRVILSVLIFLALCVVIVLLYKCHKIDKLQRNASIILSLYVVILLYFTVIGRYSHEEYENRIYFYYSYRRLIEHYDSQSMRQILLNIAMLVPVGFVLSMISNSKGKYMKAIVISLSLIIVIELLQMLTKTGSCEVDDIINNFLGALLGMGLYHIVHKLINRHKPEKK